MWCILTWDIIIHSCVWVILISGHVIISEIHSTIDFRIKWTFIFNRWHKQINNITSLIKTAQFFFVFFKLCMIKGFYTIVTTRPNFLTWGGGEGVLNNNKNNNNKQTRISKELLHSCEPNPKIRLSCLC